MPRGLRGITRSCRDRIKRAEELLGAGSPRRREDAWYEEQLVGLTVTLPDGSPIGEVAGLDIGPGQDRLRVTLAGGRTAYIPFVSALVPQVDVGAGRVVVDPPPGLLEL